MILLNFSVCDTVRGTHARLISHQVVLCTNQKFQCCVLLLHREDCSLQNSAVLINKIYRAGQSALIHIGTLHNQQNLLAYSP
jgi:hypothetical protein